MHNPATKPVFRLLAPLLLGCLVYLLVLMALGTLALLLESFFNQELLVCVLMSFAAMEANRLVATGRYFRPPYRRFVLRSLLQLVLAWGGTSLCISAVLIGYFRYQEGLTNPLSFSTELWIFNSIFFFFSLIYQGYFLGFSWMHLHYQQAIAAEEKRNQRLQADIRHFHHSLQPQLLFSGLEQIILRLREQKQEQAETSLHKLAGLYRYFLYQENEWVPLQQELQVLDHLLFLLAQEGTYFSISSELRNQDVFIPSGLLIRTVEAIAASQLSSAEAPLQLSLRQGQNEIGLQFKPNETLQAPNALHEHLMRLKQELASGQTSKLHWQKSDQFAIYFPIATLSPHESYHR